MATFKFESTIYVQDVEDADEAMNALQIALDDYDSLNPGAATIVIHHEYPMLTNEIPN